MNLGKIQIEGGFLILVALMLVFDNSGLLLPLAISVIVHEAGHFIAIKIFGGRVEVLQMQFVGLNMVFDSRQMTYLKEIIIALAGPVFSFILSYVAAVYGKAYNSEGAFFLAGVSLILGIFNSIPVRQLDGGRSLYMLVSWLFGIEVADIVICFTSCVSIFLLLIAGVGLLIITKWNFTLLAFAIWLLMCYCKYEKSIIK